MCERTQAWPEARITVSIQGPSEGLNLEGEAVRSTVPPSGANPGACGPEQDPCMSSRADHPTFHAKLGVTPHPHFREETRPPPGPEVLDLDAEPDTLPPPRASASPFVKLIRVPTPHTAQRTK